MLTHPGCGVVGNVALKGTKGNSGGALAGIVAKIAPIIITDAT